VVQDDEVGQRKKTDEPSPDVDADDQDESSAAEQDVEPSNSDQDIHEPVPNVQQANQSSPKKRTKAELDVSFIAVIVITYKVYNFFLVLLSNLNML